MFTVMFLDYRTPNTPPRVVGVRHPTEQGARQAALHMARGAARGTGGLTHMFSDRARMSVNGSTVLEFVVTEDEQ